jgi:outer membrane protein
MRKTPIILVLFFGTVLAATNQTLEQVLKRLPQSLEWQIIDQTFLVAQNNFESSLAAAGLRLTVGGDVSNNTNTVTGTNNSSYKVNATASLPVLPWASQFDDIRKAERSFERAKLDLRDSRNTLFINTNTQYFNVRLAEMDLKLATQTLNLRENQFNTAQIQRSNNQITAEQLATSGQNLETAKINAAQAENTLEFNQLTLANTLDQTELTSASSNPPVSTALLPLETLIKTALLERSDTKKAILTLRDAEDNLSIAQRDRWLPASSINLGVSDSGASLNTSLNLQSGSLSVGGSYQPPSGTPSSGTTISISASISLPVIAPTSDARITSAQTAINNAKQSLERSKKSAELDIRQKYSDTQNAIRRIDLSKKSLENAKNAFNTTQSRLNAGSLTKNDLENSRLAVQQAERDLENTMITAYTTWLRLENALGKGMTK